MGINGNYKSMGNEYEMTQVQPTRWDRNSSFARSRHSSSEDSLASAESGVSGNSAASSVQSAVTSPVCQLCLNIILI